MNVTRSFMHQYGRASGVNGVCVSEHYMGSTPAECTHVAVSQGWVFLHIRVTVWTLAQQVVGELWGWGHVLYEGLTCPGAHGCAGAPVVLARRNSRAAGPG